MDDQNKKPIFITDRMVLIGLALGTVYWLIETFLYVISSGEINFMSRLFGPDLAGVCTRIIVLCLFLIFGSHAQYTFNKRKAAETELHKIKELNIKLQQEIEELKHTQS
jgi:hypothetical protein